MRRRELLSAAMLLAAPKLEFPAEEKLSKAKREISEAMARVPLENSDAPDLLPRARKK